MPWGNQTYWKHGYGIRPVDGGVSATLEDVDYLLEASNAYFPQHQIKREHIISTWAGLRPLLAPESDDISNSNITREHTIEVGRDGVVTVAGGKLTTYRKMAAEVVRVGLKALKRRGHRPKVRRSRTAKVALPGAANLPVGGLDALKGTLKERVGAVLSPMTCDHLVDTYGTRANAVADLALANSEYATPLVEGRPEIAAQVAFAVQSEFAATATDFLIQRTQLFYRDQDQGLGALPEVVRLMGELLNWDQARKMRNCSVINMMSHPVEPGRPKYPFKCSVERTALIYDGIRGRSRWTSDTANSSGSR